MDELEARLGLDPGTIDIKPLAKTWRNLMIEHGEKAGMSHTLQEFPADNPIWSWCAGKRNPVGYFLYEIGRWLAA